MKKLLLFVLTALYLNVSAQIPSYVATDSLIGWWSFSGNANNETNISITDTIHGAALTTDRCGKANSAYSFNGTSDYISTSFAGVLGTHSRAVSFWIKTTDSVHQMFAVAWGDNQAYPNNGKRFGCGYNVFKKGVAIDGADASITYKSNFSNNNWHHYVFQFNTSSNLTSVQIYEDAVLLTTTVYTFRPSTVLNTNRQGTMQFGRIVHPSIPCYFSGKIDDIGIWNRALTQQEITKLYQTTCCSGDILVMDTTHVTVYDTTHIARVDTIHTIKYDTTHIAVYDTTHTRVTVYDTTHVHVTVNDTTYACNPDTLRFNIVFNNKKSILKCYPNPARTNLHVNACSYNLMGGYTIYIKNSQNQIVHKSLVFDQDFDIDLSGFSSTGLYFLELVDNKSGKTLEIKKLLLE